MPLNLTSGGRRSIKIEFGKIASHKPTKPLSYSREIFISFINFANHSYNKFLPFLKMSNDVAFQLRIYNLSQTISFLLSISSISFIVLGNEQMENSHKFSSSDINSIIVSGTTLLIERKIQIKAND